MLYSSFVFKIQTNPLCMHALSEDALKGNSRYVGFSVDLLEELHKKLGFEYKIKLVDDGTHDGVITEVLEGVSLSFSFVRFKIIISLSNSLERGHSHR